MTGETLPGFDPSQGIDAPPSRAEHRWRDASLASSIAELRKLCPPHAREALKKLTARLRRIDAILGDWDKHHARLAAAHIAGSRMEAASVAAHLVWDEELKLRLLRQIDHSGSSYEAAERLRLAEEFDREVLQ